MDDQLDDEMKPVIYDLLAKKTEMSEIGEGKKIDVLNEYIECQFDLILTAIDSMARENSRSWQKLNDLFLMALEAE